MSSTSRDEEVAAAARLCYGACVFDLDPLPEEGWRAALDLAYVRRGADTVPSRRAHRGPLRVQKHFAPEPGLCEHIIVHPPGGIAGGDDLEIRVHGGENTHVRLTTPGATKWYRASGRPARQRFELTMEDGGVLELLPHPHIVFDGADAESLLHVELGADARFFGWDIVNLGRQASDLPFASGRWRSTLSLTRAGRPFFHERLDLAADSALRSSTLGLGGAAAFGTALFAGLDVPDEHLAELARVSPPGLSAGITALPEVVLARATGPSAEPIFAWFSGVWSTLASAASGRPVTPPRIWRT